MIITFSKSRKYRIVISTNKNGLYRVFRHNVKTGEEEFIGSSMNWPRAKSYAQWAKT